MGPSGSPPGPQAIDGRLRTWIGQYTASHGTPPSRRTIYLMGQQIAKDTRRPKAQASRMAGGKDTGHPVSDQERLTAWEDQTTADELPVLSAVHAEAKAYAGHSTARPGWPPRIRRGPPGSPSPKHNDSAACGGSRTCAWGRSYDLGPRMGRSSRHPAATDGSPRLRMTFV
jgi:hypothetical protein